MLLRFRWGLGRRCWLSVLVEVYGELEQDREPADAATWAPWVAGLGSEVVVSAL